MKKLFIIGLFAACNMHITAFNLDIKAKSLKAGQFCGDCGGGCNKPEKEKPE